jgi:hypothetical protein
VSPHPTEGKCIHDKCGGPITDIWIEFLETQREKAAVGLGKADFTCPYCGQALRFDAQTNRIIPPQGGEMVKYHYGAALTRARHENTSIFELSRSKGMVKAGVPAFLGYTFKDRDIPLSVEEGETVHTEQENNS